VPEQSDVRVLEGSEVFSAKGPYNKKSYGNLTVSQRVVAGAHLWRERRLIMPSIFISDDLQAEIARRGLRIPSHHQLKAI
jgi:hypothetical protein